MKSVKRITTIFELMVAWGVCSTCTCTVNQRFFWPQLLMQHFMLLPQMLQGDVELLYCQKGKSDYSLKQLTVAVKKKVSISVQVT